MRRVFTNSSDVIHLFAQQSQTDARCSNVFFEANWAKNEEYGTVIYSYGHHYELGRFIDKDTILINDTGYSVTTSKHVSQLRFATRQYKQFFKTEVNLELVHREILRNKTKLASARKPELYIEPIFRLWRTLNEYADYTKAKIKRDARYREIKAIIKALNESPEDFQSKLKDLAAKQAKAKAKAEAKKLKEALPKFLNHEINSFRIGEEDYLRLSKDGERVETSQYVSVSRENAKALYEMIKRGIDVKGKHIEHYTVTSINGTLRIGCHNINMDSVHSIGKQL